MNESQNGGGPKQPSVAPAAILLGLAAVLIVVVLIKPAMAQWLKVTIVILVVLVVIALLVYAFVLFRQTTRRGPR
ncbi:putative membrane protein [Nakamurella sp. UYEF19]|uniref:hypothetical protein n=1 Tax=Nakamurella sp. UYEF19 TaxID=1756392 RepID=UPI00339A0103